MQTKKTTFAQMYWIAGLALSASLLVARCGVDPTISKLAAQPSSAALTSGATTILLGPNVSQIANARADVVQGRQRIADGEVLNRVVADLRTLSRNDQFFTRYFTLTNEWNGGAPDDVTGMVAYRNAIGKLLNSLSFAPQIVIPAAIDPNKTIFRVDIRALGWSRGLWEEITARDPYQFFSNTQQEQEIAARAGVGVGAIVRADWCASVCLQSPIYNIIMQVPGDLRQLEFDFGVDANADVQATAAGQQQRVARSGFNHSGVSSQNRVVEYHRTRIGDYWKSFDFLPEQGRVNRNIFEFALDDVNFGNGGFDFAAGEFIFQLPNGLSLYMLADNNGRRLDEAVQAVVQDPTRQDAGVTNAVSCFRCHFQGMINPPTDEVLPHFQANAFAFSQEDKALVQNLYPGTAAIQNLINPYQTKYAAALAPINAAFPYAYATGETEPVTMLAKQFEGELPLTLAAADLGLTVAEFQTLLQRVDFLARRWGNVNVADGTIKREVYEDNFGLAVEAFGLGQPFNTRGLGLVDGNSQAPAKAVKHEVPVIP